ncbi:phosphatidylinositol N-acetylglucosaminyltransferase subunit GPI1 isoform X1 [Ricinus communis]|uniref:phosphatidylinositol N-acetylglucosaminyltransferase subunit GPI1 isoform X1 n=1 Tax=Ricinus communis TaxID=3988 RepID=UPI000772139A|nr:phosphatidylinositol N-acetylglucosaminyltransferase subunit GPI1 isoform X1 [Ricinus communis]|eukprot:XP_015581438.1 phosphatidylinositol N-acetylglucosaminyltransferase subunit GPI1 isoform X1 [Ricinus communis]
MRRKCRIWWPKFLASSELSSRHLLFGWFVSCSSACIDIVVACACDEISLSCCQSNLQEVLSDTNSNMPVFLKDKAVFALLGQAAAYATSTGSMLKFGMEEDNLKKSWTNGISSATSRQDMFRENHGRKRCGCHQLNGLAENSWEASGEDTCWIQLVYDSHEQYGRDSCWLPKLHHIHWNGQVLSQLDVHVIEYETPMYGSHHFSLNSCIQSEQVKAPLKKLKWVDELDRSQPLYFNLDTVILAINSAVAAKTVIEKHMETRRSCACFSIIYACLGFMWHVFAISVASVSTLFYVTLQIFYSFSSRGLKDVEIYNTSARIFCTTWTNIKIRCSQISYWPIFLQDNGLRLRSCVEFAENAALLRHSMWSSLAVDLLLGNLFGLSLLFNAESTCLWLSTFATDFTNELLRSGCVWLMGVPAGFKLNTELAGVLGMISLNAIQIWSTLWIFIGFLAIYFIKGLAVLGILFGATIPAAMIMDIVALATFHVTTLHRAMSLLYSRQIQALAALWRLFRGRKWNPLRQRLDSYDYTVKQHTVGSLLFTPLLLLLPTTSVFYIFFTILNTGITFICVLIEVTISVIHGTPYIKILLWLVRRRRFPSGIWFEIVSCHSGSLEFVYCISPPSDDSQKREGSKKRSSTVVSTLHSNFLSIGQVVSPHYKKIFSGVSSFVTASAYGALTGTRTSSTFGTALPSTMPLMTIPGKEYWCLCYNSVLACMTECDRRPCQ